MTRKKNGIDAGKSEMLPAKIPLRTSAFEHGPKVYMNWSGDLTPHPIWTPAVIQCMLETHLDRFPGHFLADKVVETVLVEFDEIFDLC